MKHNAYLIFFVATVFCVLDYFIQASLGIISVQVMNYFQISALGFGMLGAFYYYAYLLMQIPAGYLLGRYGARMMEAGAIIFVALGLIIFSSTHYFPMACLARFLIGFGSAFAFLGALYVAEQYFPHRYFTSLAGIIQLSVSLGAILGQAPLAYVMTHFDWKVALLMLALLTFVFALVFYKIAVEATHRVTVKKACFAGLLTTLKNPQVSWICIVGMLSWVPATALILWGVPYVTHLYHMSTPNAGWLCATFWFSLCIGSPLLGWISDATRRRKIPLLFSFICGSVGSVLLVCVTHPSHFLFIFILICLGMMASMQSFSFGLLKDNVKPAHFSLIAGLCNMLAILGGAITQPMIGFLLKWHSHQIIASQHAVYAVTDFKFAFSLLSITSLVGLVMAIFLIRETKCQSLVASDAVQDAKQDFFSETGSKGVPIEAP